MNRSTFEQVKDFTTLRLNAGKSKDEFVQLPTKPCLLTEKEVRKFIGLCGSELVELARTVTDSNQEATEFVRNCIGMDPSKDEPVFKDDIDRLADQIDATADLNIYSADMCAGHGFPMDEVFAEVHKANMSKTFPDGTFHLKEIEPGIFKVAKPPNFKAPNVRKIVEATLKKE
jgi:predicted HAD superfamily Cof-like phosphohydrolase